MTRSCSSHGIETPERTIARKDGEIEALKEANRLLEAKLDHLVRRLFGCKGELIDPAQLELLFKDMPGKPEASPGAVAPEEAASNAAEQRLAARKRAAHRSRITGLDNLPTEIIPDLVVAAPESFERCGRKSPSNSTSPRPGFSNPASSA